MDEFYDRAGHLITYEGWARLFRDRRYKRVAVDEQGDVRISTVWLGMNHAWDDGPPLIFETMIFGGPHDEWLTRYSTEDEALRGHDAVRRWAEAGFPEGGEPR